MSIKTQIRDFAARLSELRHGFHATWNRSQTPAPNDHAPATLSLDSQWAMIETYVASNTTRSQSLLQMQDTVTRHLDAAQYALGRIAVELTDVMPTITEVATDQTLQEKEAPDEDVRAPAGARKSIAA